jgi:hypothetical protein
MARTPWQNGESQQTTDYIDQNADYAGLLASVHISVSDAVEEAGGTRNVAIALLRDKGVDVGSLDKKAASRAIQSQQRNIQRWQNYEKGITGKQAHKPSAAGQAAINRAAGENRINADEGLDVHIEGQVTINGYERDSPRTIDIHMNPEQARAFVANPTFEKLASAYGVAELHTYPGTTLQVY